MRRGLTYVALLAIAAAVASGSCSFDTDRSAPHVQSPIAAGACGTTETLLPKLLEFLREDRFEPLRTVLTRRLLPTEEDPNPDPSLRALLGAVVRLISGLGLDRTALIVDIAKKGEVEEKLAPLVVTVLRFMDGQIDGRSRYATADAAALFIRRCNPDHLLTAVESILRLESPSHGKPWLTAVLEEAGPLVAEPSLQPLLETFESGAARGKPAIVSLLVQIMIFLADEAFAIDRVEVLLESAVYPITTPELRAKIEALVAMLDEATRPEAGILEPLQGSVRCGLMHPEARDELLGFGYDLIASEEVGLAGLIETTNALVDEDGARSELALIADTVRVIREDEAISDDLRELLAILSSQPDVQLTVPVLIDLVEEGVVAELLEAIVTLLGGCGRHV